MVIGLIIVINSQNIIIIRDRGHIISYHNIAAIAAALHMVLAALALVRGQVDGAPYGSPVPPAMVQSFYVFHPRPSFPSEIFPHLHIMWAWARVLDWHLQGSQDSQIAFIPGN